MYPQVFGKYVLERELAKGGMARVVLATLRGAGGFEKRLVVKQIRDDLASDEDFVRRFVEEAKTTVALAHPNIVPVYELGVELGTYFLAMEFVEGASLAEILRLNQRDESARPKGADSNTRKTAPMSPEEGAYVGIEVCRALDYAHRRMNVVHRDVTPRNVMVDEEGQVKVIDFGISAPVATTQEGHGVFGSPGHMPPEQMEGKNLTPAADVFAVAVLLMELWSGKAVFRRHTTEAIEAALKGPHPKPSDADVRLLPLDDVIASALSLDPKVRPQQADDLGRALRKFLTGMDLGDVARKLGDRVKRVRTNPPAPTSEKLPVLQRPPSRPFATQVGTKTFAAREEVLPTASTPASRDEGSSTRRLDSVKPDAVPKEIETVATRPIETDPRDQKTGAGEAKKRSAAWIGFAAAGVVAIGAFLLGRGAGGSLVTPAETSSAATASLSVPAASSSAPAASSSVRAAPSSTGAPGLTVAVASSSAGTVGGSAPSAGLATVEAATLWLLGDGTTVAIDGTVRGTPPIKAIVESGTHTVTFTFPATGESKGTSVTLKRGEKATLRADFTGATPTIRVTR